jgi:hypothetical protein
MSVESLILSATEEAQGLLDELYRQTPEPASGSALDQAGLRDGASIIRDYLEHGEAGLAFEHLIYMIIEPGLHLSEESCRKIRKAGQALGFSESAYSEACGLTSR